MCVCHRLHCSIEFNSLCLYAVYTCRYACVFVQRVITSHERFVEQSNEREEIRENSKELYSKIKIINTTCEQFEPFVFELDIN